MLIDFHVTAAPSCFLQFHLSSCRPSDERHPTVIADATVDNLAQAVEVILSQRGCGA